MKNLLLSFLLLTVIACNGGGGSSASSTPESPVDNTPADPVDPGFIPDPNHAVVNYSLVFTGCDGAMFDSLAFVNYESNDEIRSDFPGTLDASGTTNISLTGREILWTVDNIGSCPITMSLYRDGMNLEQSKVIQPGDTAEIFY